MEQCTGVSHTSLLVVLQRLCLLLLLSDLVGCWHQPTRTKGIDPGLDESAPLLPPAIKCTSRDVCSKAATRARSYKLAELSIPV